MDGNGIKFGLRKITTGQFATIDSVAIQENAIKLNFGFGFGINEELKIAGCHAKFEFLSNGIPFIVLSVTCDYEILPESWEKLINKESNAVVLPVSLVTHLAFLTVGTARGILHCKTENTPLNKYFLPTLNVAESFKSDITIALQK